MFPLEHYTKGPARKMRKKMRKNADRIAPPPPCKQIPKRCKQAALQVELQGPSQRHRNCLCCNVTELSPEVHCTTPSSELEKLPHACNLSTSSLHPDGVHISTLGAERAAHGDRTCSLLQIAGSNNNVVLCPTKLNNGNEFGHGHDRNNASLTLPRLVKFLIGSMHTHQGW